MPVGGLEHTSRSSSGGFAYAAPTMTIEARLQDGGTLVAREVVYTGDAGMSFVWLAPSPDSEPL